MTECHCGLTASDSRSYAVRFACVTARSLEGSSYSRHSGIPTSRDTTDASPLVAVEICHASCLLVECPPSSAVCKVRRLPLYRHCTQLLPSGASTCCCRFRARRLVSSRRVSSSLFGVALLVLFICLLFLATRATPDPIRLFAGRLDCHLLDRLRACDVM